MNTIKLIVYGFLVISLVSLMAWIIVDIKAGASASATLDVVQTQGELRDQDANLAVEALQLETSILSEPDDVFNLRMQLYWAENGGSESPIEPAKGLPSPEYFQPCYPTGRFSEGAETEVESILQDTNILSEDSTALLSECLQPVNIWTEDGKLVNRECLQ